VNCTPLCLYACFFFYRSHSLGIYEDRRACIASRAVRGAFFETDEYSDGHGVDAVTASFIADWSVMYVTCIGVGGGLYLRSLDRKLGYMNDCSVLSPSSCFTPLPDPLTPA
jgi:hypothetical protein